MMCSSHPRTPGAYKVASGDAHGHWPMFATYSGCTMRACTKLYDYILTYSDRTSICDAGTARWLGTRAQSPRSALCVTYVIIIKLLYYYSTAQLATEPINTTNCKDHPYM